MGDGTMQGSTERMDAQGKEAEGAMINREALTGEDNIVLSTRNLKFRDFLCYPDLAIREGRRVFITGESGAGKSTLFKLFNYTYSPSQGEIRYRGELTDSLDPVELRKKVLLVSQSVFLFPGSIAWNFDQFYQYRGEKPLSGEEKKHFLQLAQVPFALEDGVDTMSGGERQRVYLAICLSFKPDVLMLDEPTAALDHDTAFRLFQGLRVFIQEEKMTLLVISHDRELLDAFAQDVIALLGGRNECGKS